MLRVALLGELLQSAFDGLYPPGLQWYWKTDFFNEPAGGPAR